MVCHHGISIRLDTIANLKSPFENCKSNNPSRIFELHLAGVGFLPTKRNMLSPDGYAVYRLGRLLILISPYSVMLWRILTRIIDIAHFILAPGWRPIIANQECDHSEIGNRISNILIMPELWEIHAHVTCMLTLKYNPCQFKPVWS
jgi:hypothetical protein